MSAVYDRVAQLLTDKFGVPAEDVTPQATFEDLDLDSLDIVEFALAAEEAFGVRISEDETTDLENLADIVKLLEHKGAAV